MTDPIDKEIELFQAEIRGAFDDRQFEEIENLAGQLREGRETFSNGSWKIYRFYEGLGDRFHSGEDGYLTDLDTHRAWRKAYPDSVTERIALADLLVDYAWHARGTGYANTVTPEGWRLMGERLDQADAALAEAKKIGGEDIYWYSVAIMMGTGQGWDKERFDEVVAESLEREPTYWSVPAHRAYTLLPRWFGDEGDWEAFALKASQAPGGLGDETYTRIVIRLSGYYANVFRDARPSWPRTKSGLEIMLKKYPDSLWIRNWAAKLGTLGQDREFAKAWFDRLGDEYIKEVWKKPERFVHFRGWAETGQW
ncbi:MAG: DUF4034 domain-containing protein [Verrucomicrobiae bacterium]|nr:DUF4034 domain-containing protein [Verrucomicrobiae bacterium]